MRALNKTLATGALVAAMAAAGWAATSASASAEVVCNQWHECWRVHDHFNDYPAGVGIVFHPDGWHGKHYHWRDDNFGHGYYRNGVWIAF